MNANYGLVWVYNSLKSVIGCLRDRQNFSESSEWHWHVNTLQVWREHFVKFVTSLLISVFFWPSKSEENVANYR